MAIMIGAVLLAVPLAVVAGIAAWVHDEMMWRDFERKYMR